MRYFWLSKPAAYHANPASRGGAAAFDKAGCNGGDCASLPPETLEILVMVANDRSAVLCANCNGVTRLIRRIKCPCQRNMGAQETGLDHIGRDSKLGRSFARDLIATLERDVGKHHYDGVIVLADASIYRDLCRTPTSKVPHILIAHLMDASSDFSRFACAGTTAAGHFVQ